MIVAAFALVNALAQAAPGDAESVFLRAPSASGARASSKVLNRYYHYAGTPGDYKLAVYMRDTLLKYGLKAWIEPFETTVYTPRMLQLQILTPLPFTFDLRDGKIAADPDGSRPGVPLPFNAGSGNGDVRAHVFDAGRGLDADYARLESAGVGVHGNIALIRYGAEYRGNLAARAQARGAAGVIFYNSPKDETPGSAYPTGPNRPPGAVQRGDVMADDNVPLRIPTLPVTLFTAQRLLANMHGKNAPVHLYVAMNSWRTTLWNTIGEATGIDSTQSVVLGGHRDGWVYGVTDDGSGISTLLEVARGLGALQKTGWRPGRTIRIAGWDGEEIGDLGSGEYVRAHRDELARGCIAYINVDESAAGPHFRAAIAGALTPMVVPAVQSVLNIAAPKVDDPSGGSDYEPFIYALGTPIVNLGYGGAFGTYHSTYDDFRYAELFADPGFVHHRTIAQTAGLIAIRLADAASIPYRFGTYGKSLDAALNALTKSASQAKLTLGPDLQTAVVNFKEAAAAYDDGTQPPNDAKALQAAQRLDLVAYSANGYASIAFPKIAAAIATRRQSDLDAAVKQTVGELDGISALLGPLPTAAPGP